MSISSPVRPLHAFSIFLLALAFAACEGAEGPAGAIGPEGPRGPAGPQGPPGNANVRVVTLPYSFAVSSGFGSTTFTVSEITARTINEGAVIPYLETGTNTWTPLPWSYIDAASCLVTYTPAAFTGTFQLFFQDECGRFGTNSGRVRLVLMAGSNGFLGSGAPPPYSELATRFGLPAD